MSGAPPRAQLARLRATGAPACLVDDCRRELEPQALLLERLEASPAIEAAEIVDPALRAKRPIPRLVDDEGRRAGPTAERRLWLVHGFVSADPRVHAALFGAGTLAIDGVEVLGAERGWVHAALFGAGTLVIDGVEVLGAERGWVHAAAAIPDVRRFFEGLLERPPPPLADDRRWYPQLHPDQFAIQPDTPVPADGPLAWEYARGLAGAARASGAVVSMLKHCERRRGACRSGGSRRPRARAGRSAEVQIPGMVRRTRPPTR